MKRALSSLVVITLTFSSLSAYSMKKDIFGLDGAIKVIPNANKTEFKFEFCGKVEISKAETTEPNSPIQYSVAYDECSPMGIRAYSKKELKGAKKTLLESVSRTGMTIGLVGTAAILGAAITFATTKRISGARSSGFMGPEITKLMFFGTLAGLTAGGIGGYYGATKISFINPFAKDGFNKVLTDGFLGDEFQVFSGSIIEIKSTLEDVLLYLDSK